MGWFCICHAKICLHFSCLITYDKLYSFQKKTAENSSKNVEIQLNKAWIRDFCLFFLVIYHLAWKIPRWYFVKFFIETKWNASQRTHRAELMTFFSYYKCGRKILKTKNLTSLAAKSQKRWNRDVHAFQIAFGFSFDIVKKMISGPTRAEKGDILIHVFTQKK